MSGREWVDTVKERVQIMEVASQYTRLKSHGTSWRGPCPLHEGKGDNFAVYPGRGTYKCFVCDESGDAFKLVMLKENIPFIEAAKRLAAMVGVTVPEWKPARQSPEQRARADRQSALLAAESAADLWTAFPAGLTSVAERAGLSVRSGPTGPELTVPIGGQVASPTGWLRVGPEAATLDAASDAGTESQLYAPPVLKAEAYRQTLVLTDHPLAALDLWARGHGAVMAPVSWAIRGPEAPLLSAEGADRIALLKPRRIVILVPTSGALRAARLRALFAAEPLLLARGIEPLWFDAGAHASALEWLAAHPDLSGGDLEALWRDSRRTVDLFQRRVEQVVAMRSRVPAVLSLAQAMDKLSPSLEAVRASGDRVLYHAYTSWAARALGIRDRSRLVIGGGAGEAGEAF